MLLTSFKLCRRPGMTSFLLQSRKQAQRDDTPVLSQRWAVGCLETPGLFPAVYCGLGMPVPLHEDRCLLPATESPRAWDSGGSGRSR